MEEKVEASGEDIGPQDCSRADGDGADRERPLLPGTLVCVAVFWLK